MALYDIVSGNTAVASDIEQLITVFNGKHDIGNISLAPQISAPSSGSFSLTSQSGSSLGVGAYNYQFSYITGQYKSDGITLVQTAETTVSSALSITTTSGNTTVKVTLPTSGLPTSAIAINIYRTSVGGSDYKLVATVKIGSANYTDNVADASRGSQTPPSSNTTGTSFNTTLITPTLLNGWVQNYQCYYWKDSNNTVFYSFSIMNGATAANSTFMIFPAGFRPQTAEMHMGFANGSGVICSISTSGYFQNLVAMPSATNVVLMGSFKAVQ
jgi:hypothetical protein